MRQKRGRALEFAAQVAVICSTKTAFSAALLGAAATFGTASTGTAIGALSGAASMSAALAWIGGSVVGGAVIMGMGGMAASVLAATAIRRLIRKHVSAPPQKHEELTSDEAEHLVALSHLLIALKRLVQEKPSQPRLI